MTRYWTSWKSSYHVDDGCHKPPFQIWTSGESVELREFSSGVDAAYLTICAVLDAEDEAAVWSGVAEYFPDYEERFIEPRADDWQPSDRFQDFKGNTSLDGEGDING